MLFFFTQGIRDNTDPSDNENDGEDADNLKQKKYQDYVKIHSYSEWTFFNFL